MKNEKSIMKNEKSIMKNEKSIMKNEKSIMKNKKSIIKRIVKRKLIKYPKETENNTNFYTGIVFYSTEQNQITKKDRILLNFTKIYLTGNDTLYCKHEQITDIVPHIRDNLFINKDDIININKIINKNNKKITTYLIQLKFYTKIDTFKERIFTDFYEYTENGDLYTNILKQNTKKQTLINNHISYWYLFNLENSENTKHPYIISLEKIYKQLVGTIAIPI